MSLIGNPKIEFMDEPSTGVDPVSCRSLFKLLKNLQDSSMILTTHRMDEAESLCDNLVIMINGRFVCYGSPGQIKSKFGTGYTFWMTSDQSSDCLKIYCLQNLSYLNFVNEEQPNKSNLVKTNWDTKVQTSELGGLSKVV